MEPDAIEMRVLGCLLEKQRTTPDSYPLTLNALRLACNQSTNRDPVVDYSERDIRAALERLGKRRWTRLASWGNSRVMKYRQLLDETLELSDAELSALAVLMLRGPQTLGELNQRTERLHRYEGDELERTLQGLIERERVRMLPRRPGERGARYLQLLGGDAESEAASPIGAEAPSADVAEIAAADESSGPAQSAPVAATPVAEPLEDDGPPDDVIAAAELVGRVEHLERELVAVRRELAALRAELGG